MPTSERSMFSIQEVIVRFLIPMLIGGGIVYLMMQYAAGPGGDRPPIIVSDGSIKVDEVDSSGGPVPSGGKGTFKTVGTSGSRTTWKHEHPDKGPKRLHVLVEGSDAALSSNCPAVYFVQDIATATLAYRYTGGDRTVVVSRDSSDNVVFDVDKDADVKQTGGLHTLLIDEGGGADLVSVTFGWGPGNPGSVTCQFGTSPAPRLTLLQTTK